MNILLEETLLLPERDFGFLSLYFEAVTIHAREAPGTAHLLEHLLVELRSRKTGSNLYEFAKAKQASVLAFTDLHAVSLHFLVPRNLDLRDFVSSVTGHLESLSPESKVIGDEVQVISSELHHLKQPGHMFKEIFSKFSSKLAAVEKFFAPPELDRVSTQNVSTLLRELLSGCRATYAGPSGDLDHAFRRCPTVVDNFLNPAPELVESGALALLETFYKNLGTPFVKILDLNHSLIFPMQEPGPAVPTSAFRKTIADSIHFAQTPPLNLDRVGIRAVKYLRGMSLAAVAEVVGQDFPESIKPGELPVKHFTFFCRGEKKLNEILLTLRLCESYLYEHDRGGFLRVNLIADSVNVLIYPYSRAATQKSAVEFLRELLEEIVTSDTTLLLEKLKNAAATAEIAFPHIFQLHHSLVGHLPPGAFEASYSKLDTGRSLVGLLQQAQGSQLLVAAQADPLPELDLSKFDGGRHVVMKFETEERGEILSFKRLSDAIEHRIFDLQKEWQAFSKDYLLNFYSHVGVRRSFVVVSVTKTLSPEERQFLCSLLRRYYEESPGLARSFSKFDEIYYGEVEASGTDLASDVQKLSGEVL